MDTQKGRYQDMLLRVIEICLVCCLVEVILLKHIHLAITIV